MMSPCKDCQHRYIGCHTVCKLYQEYVREREDIRKRRRRKNMERDTIESNVGRMRRNRSSKKIFKSHKKYIDK